MKVAIVADAHLIDPEDPHEGRRSVREAFVDAWPSFRRLIDRLNDEAVDHVILTGDLVDYYSEENREFALDLVDGFDMPCHHVPGNHDFQLVDESDGDVVITTDRETALAGWREAGIQLENRVLDVDDIRFLLMDSALSDVPSSTERWLTEHVVRDRHCILCTHVPLDRPPVVRAITDREPDRNLDKYVQRGVPGLYDRCLANGVDAVVSGHLHFSATATVGNTRQHILPLSVRRQEPTYPEEGTVAIVDTSDPGSFHPLRASPQIE